MLDKRCPLVLLSQPALFCLSSGPDPIGRPPIKFSFKALPDAMLIEGDGDGVKPLKCSKVTQWSYFFHSHIS